ncbi:putative cyclic nucleotide-gated ion channel 20, chloroplastic [Glycine soja]
MKARDFVKRRNRDNMKHMANFEKDEVPIFSDIHPKLSNELVDSKFPRRVPRTRSVSISIPATLTEPYERDTNLVGYTGPLRSQRKTPFDQMSGPLYVTNKPGNLFRQNRVAPEYQTAESKTENFPSCCGMGENDLQNNYAGKNEHLIRSGPLGMCNDPYCTTCPTYFKATQQMTSKASGIFNPKFRNTLYGDARDWARRLFDFLIPLVPRVMNPHNRLVQQWNKFFAICCLVAIFVDPLFFFLLSVQKNHQCIVIDWTMTKMLVVLRSMNDFIHFLNIVLQFRLAYVAPESRVVGAGELVDHPKKIALHYLRTSFVIDLFVVLPLPQIFILFVQPKHLGSSGANYAGFFLPKHLRIVIIVQYIPRLCRFLPMLISPTGLIFESPWASFFINLFTFMLSGHVVGSWWYLFGLQRVNQCLRDVCQKVIKEHNECAKFIDCGHGQAEENQNNPTLHNWRSNSEASSCFTEDGFPYGIYNKAVNLTADQNVITRYVYSSFWGFQQISTLAGNLTPSYYVWEVIFTMAIIGSGLLLFALLIGNIQNFLQALGRRRLEMSLRRCDVEQWMSHRRLAEDLRRRVRQAERYNWAATRGVNEEMLLENLPEDLQRDIRRHLFTFIKKVSTVVSWPYVNSMVRIFALLDEPILDAICERLRQKTYIKGSKIFYDGGLVEKMVFIVRGKLESVGEDGISAPLYEGSVCGEELLTWCLEHPLASKGCGKARIPRQKLVSNRTVGCLTNVEAFSLRAADLEEVTSLFARFFRSPRVQGAIRYESPYWRCFAATSIQVAWRYRMKCLSRADTTRSNEISKIYNSLLAIQFQLSFKKFVFTIQIFTLTALSLNYQGSMANFENDKLLMLSDTDAQPYDEPLDAKFRRTVTRTQSASISISMSSFESYDKETSLVGHTGPLQSKRKTPFMQMSGPLYATTGTGNPLQKHIVSGNKAEERKTDNFATLRDTGSNYWNNDYDRKNEHLLRSGQLGMCNDPYCTTCPTYFNASQQRNPKPSTRWDPKFHNALYGDAKSFVRKLLSFCYSYVPGVMNPHAKVDNKCIVINWPLTTALVLFRCVTDFVYFLNILLQFRLAYVSRESRVVGAGDLVDHPKRIALHYLKDNDIVCPTKFLGGSKLCQESSPCSDLSAIYPQVIQRVNQCLRDACHSSNIPGCMKFIDCGRGHGKNQPSLRSDQWINNTDAVACLDPSPDGFSYGIYENAVPLTIETNIVNKYVYSLFWGFQQISTLAGNLEPSYFVWEVLFTMAIIGMGLLLFAILIGNIQNFLQALGRRKLEMQLRGRDVEQWMSHRRLPEDLRRRVRQAERYNWAATRGVNEEMLMENLPEDLQRDIRRHLFKFVKKIRLFALMDEPILDAICDRLRQKTYIKGSKILSQGGLVEKMVFVVRGKLESIGEDGTRIPLSEGDSCGEELLTWYLEHSSVSTDGRKVRLPGQRLVSNRKVRCLTNVESFSLSASDIEEVTILFTRFLRSPCVQGALRYESPYWRSLAATRIQVAWRYRKKRLSRVVQLQNIFDSFTYFHVQMFLLKNQQGKVANFEKHGEPAPSETHAQHDELENSRFGKVISRTKSASISIPMVSMEPYERETSLVGHTGPLPSVRKSPIMHVNGSLYATNGTENLLHQSIFVKGNKVVESKTEKISTLDRKDENHWNNNYDRKNEHLLRSGLLGMCNDPYCTTCPTYFRASLQRFSKASTVFDPQFHFHNALYGDAKGLGRKIMSFFSSYVPGVINPHSKGGKCISIDWDMTKVLVVVRTMNDVIYFLNILLQFRLAYVSPESTVVGAGDLVDHPKKIALHYLKGYFLFDLFVVFPLPQIMIFLVLPKHLGTSGANYAKNLLRAVILVQYIPKLFRILPLLIGQSPTGFIFESAWANFIINLLIYMLASHVVGSCWYLFGLQRVNQCLRDACGNSDIDRCMTVIDCGRHGHTRNNYSDQTSSLWSNNSDAIACLNPSSSGFRYGIYVNGVPLTIETSVANKYIYSLFWGFQQISTLAGSLTPSYFWGEVLFTMAIIGLGLLLFAVLVGNIHNFLQGLGRRRLEMQLRGRDVEQWMSHRRLPEDIRRKVRQAERYNWAATKGVNEEMLMENLPGDLQREIRRHLFKFVKKVRIFTLMDEPFLDSICERLRQKTYIKGSIILSQGCLVEKMIFIVRGKLESIGENGIGVSLSEGDACGEELLTWYLEHSSVSKDGKRVRLPGQRWLSNRTVKCLTNVEAFSIRAEDLEEVTTRFMRFLRNLRVQGSLRYESPYWRSLAAVRIQVAWRYRKKRKNCVDTSKLDQSFNS